MGAAIEVFEGSQLIEVGRDRFVPVKTTNDLLVLRSDVYDIGKDFVLDQVAAEVPFVDLDADVLQARRRLRPALPRGRAVAGQGDLAQGRGRLDVRPRRAGARRRRARRPVRPAHRRRHRAAADAAGRRLTWPTPAWLTGLRSVDEHLATILDATTPLPDFAQPLLDALDLACAEDIASTMQLPRFDNSAHGRLRRAPRRRRDRRRRGAGQAAGGRRDRRRPGRRRVDVLARGTAAKIMTGAPLPAGADAVVPYEWTDRGAAEVWVAQAPERRPAPALRRRGRRGGRPAGRGRHRARPAPPRPARLRRPHHRAGAPAPARA